MYIRKLIFAVTENGISPKTEQSAGVQGEHNPTEVEFGLSQGLRDKLANYGSDILYRFDIYDADGCVFRSEAKSLLESNTIKEAVSILIGEPSTRFGGKIKIYLVITALNNGETVMEFSSHAARLRLEGVPEGVPTDAEYRESLTSLVEKAKAAADLSQDILDEFEALNPIGFEINASGHLIVTLADGNTQDLGNVKGDKGDKGDTGATGAPGPAGVGVPSGGTAGQVLTKNSGTNYDTEWRTLPNTVPLVSGSDMAAATPQSFNNGAKVQCSSTYNNYLKGQFYEFCEVSQWVYYWKPVNVDFYRRTGEQLDSFYDDISSGMIQLTLTDIFFCTEDYVPQHSLLTDDTVFHQGYFYRYTGYDLLSRKCKFIRINIQPSSGGGGTTDYTDLTNKPSINNVILSGNKSASDLGLLGSSDTLPVGSVEVDVNSVKPYDYEQTYTIPNNITSGSTVYVEFAYPLREFVLEITTPEAVISAGTGYFYLSLENNVGGGRFWEPALGQSHASKLCISFSVGRDGIYRVYGYKYGLTSDTDYSAAITYNGFSRQNIGRLYLSNPQAIYKVFFTSSGDISELAGSTIKVRGLKW